MKPTYVLYLLLASASGAAALSHELLWTRRLVDILGAGGEATTLTLGCFFCGLSLGAAIAARFLRLRGDAWKTLARLEFAIAVLTIPAVLLPSWTSWVWPTLGPEVLTSWFGRFTKLAISGAVVLPPATAMGMTLPVLIVAISRVQIENYRSNVWVYAFNTLGGAFGLLVTSVWLLPSFGVLGCMLIAALTNVGVGVLALLLSSRQPAIAKPQQLRDVQSTKTSTSEAEPPRMWLLVMAGFSGFAVLGLEVVVIRLLSLVVPSSFQATSSVLLAVILLLGVAALLVPMLLRLFPRPILLLALALCGAAVTSALAPLILYGRTKQLIDVPHLVAIDDRAIDGLLGFQMEVLSVALVTVGPALLLAAMVFPMLLACIDRGKTDNTGRVWATLLAVNGIGGLLGTITAERILIPGFGIYGAMVVAGVSQAIIACFAVISISERRRWWLVLPGGIALLFCLLLQRQVTKLPYISPHTKFKYELLEARFGKEGICCVVETQTGSKGIMVNNQYLLGTSGVYDAQRRQVSIPLMLHKSSSHDVGDSSANVCCLGLATGISAGAALDFDKDIRVTAVELSPLVISVAKDYFSNENRNLADDPRGTIVAEDARTYMAAVPNTYDVIAGDLYRPYGSGQGRLYSVEHFRNVRQALRADGIYCQWIPAYQITEEHFNTIAASFVRVFPEAILLCADSDSKHPMLGLLGTNDSELSELAQREIEDRCNRFADRVDFDPKLRTPGFAKALFVRQLTPEQFENVEANTLDNAILEISAGLHRATHDRRPSKSKNQQDSYLRGHAWRAFLQKMRQSTGADQMTQ